MKVLVSGATGFIGNYVVEGLLRHGHTVIASSANKEKAMLADWYEKVIYKPLDFERLEKDFDYYKFFQQPDLMIHLAWEGLPNYKGSFHEDVNLPRHLFFLKNIISNGLQDLTVAGTCFEYGMQEGCLEERAAVLPTNPYGRAKNSLRMELEEFHKLHAFSFKWMRLFYMYGKGQNSNSLLSQLAKAIADGDAMFNMSGGQQVRDFLPVEKVADNIIKIACQRKVEGVINNCSGVPVTVENFILEYLKNNGKKIKLNLGYYPYPDYEPMKFWGDVSKLKKAITDE